MEPLYIDEVVFPVVSMKKRKFDYLGLWGTAFYIGGNYFLTAKHVIEAAKSSLDSGHAEYMAIGQPELDDKPERDWKFATITEFEIAQQIDVAIFKVQDNFNNIFTPKWNITGLQVFDDVRSAGYPYSLDIENRVINLRGIKGHVIGTGKQRLGSIQFRSYELNFQAPRGLSGAPLFDDTHPPKVCGIIIGNRSHEMEVASMKEILGDGERIETFTRIEIMHIGVAIMAKELIAVEFKLLNGAILGHLRRNNLFA